MSQLEANACIYMHARTLSRQFGIADNWREHQVIFQIFSQGSVYNGEIVRSQIAVAIPAKHSLSENVIDRHAAVGWEQPVKLVEDIANVSVGEEVSGLLFQHSLLQQCHG